jgi:hypothetical protein
MTTKRPPVLALENFLVNTSPPPAPAPECRPTLESTPTLEPQPQPAPTFRTSVYFHRGVHDVLRDIAHDERKSVTDLINEGLDHVLAKRNYPGTADLRRRK